MPLTPAERQRKKREADRQAGLVSVRLVLPREEVDRLHALHVAACPDEPWGMFLRRSLARTEPHVSGNRRRDG